MRSERDGNGTGELPPPNGRSSSLTKAGRTHASGPARLRFVGGDAPRWPPDQAGRTSNASRSPSETSSVTQKGESMKSSQSNRKIPSESCSQAVYCSGQ